MRPNAVPRAAGILTLLLLTSAAPERHSVRAMISELHPIASPAAPGSVAPSLAVSPAGVVWLTWLEPRAAGGHALRAARLDGVGWRSPVTIAEGDSFFVNRSDIPTLLPRGGGRLVAHYLWKSGSDPMAHEVRLTQSHDDGATWSPPEVPHRDGTPTEHGFVSLIESGEGTRAVWLDGRQAVSDSAGRWIARPEGQYETTLRTSVLGPARGFDDEWELDMRVCDCCPTAAVVTPAGPLIAYRGRSAAEVRDIWITRMEGGRWSEPRVLHADGWKIPGCPVNGPSLSAEGERVAVAWFTEAQDTARVMVAFSDDGGAHFSDPVRVDGGHPLGRVQVRLLAGGEALVCWLAGEGQDARFQVRRLVGGRTAGPALTVARTAARGSGLPRMAVAGNRVVLAWTQASKPPIVRTALAQVALSEALNDAR